VDRDLPYPGHGDDRIRPRDRPGVQSEGGRAELWHFPDRCFLLHGPAVLHGVRTFAQAKLRVQGQADPVFRDAEEEVQYPDIALSRVERDLHDPVPHHRWYAHSVMEHALVYEHGLHAFVLRVRTAAVLSALPVAPSVPEGACAEPRPGFSGPVIGGFLYGLGIPAVDRGWEQPLLRVALGKVWPGVGAVLLLGRMAW